MSNPQNDVVKFFRENKENGYLSNFFPMSNRIIARLPNQLDSKGEPVLSAGFINIDGKEELEWYTSEHLFQALKFTGTNKDIDLVKQILNQTDTMKALKLGQSKLARSGWVEPDNYRLIAMKYAVRQKFSQNEKLKNDLLATGNKTIIEDTKSANQTQYQNDFWGNGPNGKGANHLGKILMEVRTKLQNEGPPLDPLKDLKGNTINQINQKMAEGPEIKTSELQSKNQNWENDIQTATQKDRITSIYNELIADIEAKRKDKKLAQAFQKLISQAQQARQGDNIDTLTQLLTQIYNYHEHSGLYSQHENEIKQWETYVNQQDDNNFKILKISAINNLLQQEPKVTISELREFNRGFKRIISQTSDFAKIRNFESIVRDNVIEVRTEKKFNQLLTSAQNAKSEEEKSLVAQQVYKWRDSTDRWESETWQQRKSEAEAFLNKWSRGEDNDNNDENTKDESHWLKQVFQIAAVGISLALVIWLLAKLAKKERKFK